MDFKDFLDALGGAFRHWYIVVTIAVVAMVIYILFAFILPRYKAHGKEMQEITKPPISTQAPAK